MKHLWGKAVDGLGLSIGERTYDEDPPRYIHYTIEWRVTVNNRAMSKDTEQDVIVAPASY
jgi:hypothetical protein